MCIPSAAPLHVIAGHRKDLQGLTKSCSFLYASRSSYSSKTRKPSYYTWTFFSVHRKNVIDPEDARCARLTLTGQMVTVPPEEVEFAKQAMFSRSVCNRHVVGVQLADSKQIQGYGCLVWKIWGITSLIFTLGPQSVLAPMWLGTTGRVVWPPFNSWSNELQKCN